MQKEEEKFADSTVLEGMTSLRALWRGQKAGVNDRRILHLYYDESRREKLKKELSFLRHEGERQSFDLIPLSHDEMAAKAIGKTHGGILAECSGRSIPPLSDVPACGRFAVMLEGVEDPYNFGYAVRSLYACGVDLLVLPVRNWMSAAGVVARASAGASEECALATAEPAEAVRRFRERGFRMVCADAETDLAVEDAELPFPLFLIVGGERRGISAAVMHEADQIVRLNYGRAFNNALSAASAAAILAYEILRKNKGQ